MIEGLHIVDNFFDDPDFVRNYATSLRTYQPCDFFRKSGIFSGYRTAINNQKIESELISKVEKIYNRKLLCQSLAFHLNTHTSMLGCPHKDIGASDTLHKHSDIAGVVYLSKEAPAGCGTALYKDPPSGITIDAYHDKMQILYDVAIPPNNRIKKEIANEMRAFKNTLEIVAQSEHVYNTLIIYSAHALHAPGFYFGDTINNGRLTIPIHAIFEE